MGAKVLLPPSTHGSGLSMDCDLPISLSRAGLWDLDADALNTVGCLRACGILSIADLVALFSTQYICSIIPRLSR